MDDGDVKHLLNRLVEALERLSPSPATTKVPADVDAFIWHADASRLEPVQEVNRLDIAQLVGIERARDTLLSNTRTFADGYPANNALLWGARGMGKSSLVKAVHGTVAEESEGSLVMVEIHREDLSSLPKLLSVLRLSERKFILFCDDLSFDATTRRTNR